MTERPARRADEILAGLADAFDAVAPADRAAAEEELRESGRDPRAVARAIAALAADPGARRRLDRAPTPGGTVRPWRRWSIAALLALTVGAAAWVALRPVGRERLARVLPELPARSGEPAAVGRAAPPASEGSSHPLAADGVQPTPAAGATPAARGRIDDAAVPGEASPGQTSPASGRRAWGGHLGALVLDHGLPVAVAEALSRHGIARQVVADPAPDTAAALIAASAGNAGLYEVDAQTCALRARAGGPAPEDGFGFPFPFVAGRGDAAGCMIMWNAAAAVAAAGGRRADVDYCAVTANGDGWGCEPGSFAGTAFTGRPAPALANPGDLRTARRLILPTRIRGSLLSLRALAAERSDVTWWFDHARRRVAKIDSSARADGIGNMQIAPDDLDCFDGKVEAFSWTVLAPSMEIQAPVALPNAGSPSRPDRLAVMPRPVWVLEGRPRDPRYALGRVLLYVDAQRYRPYWKVAYDRDGIERAVLACPAAWQADAPLTSAVLRLGPGPDDVALLAPRGEVFDQGVDDEWFTLRELTRTE